MFGLYSFENYYFGRITKMEPVHLEWEKLNNNGNNSYPTLLLKRNDEKYIDLFHENRNIIIKRNENETCYILDTSSIEPVGNYFPQDMLNNKKYLTRNQAITYFGNLRFEYDKKNTKNDGKKMVYKKNN